MIKINSVLDRNLEVSNYQRQQCPVCFEAAANEKS